MASKSTRKPMHDDTRAAIEAVSLGMVRDIDSRNDRRRELGLRETINLFQCDISGAVASNLTWTEVEIGFDYHFYYSPGTHDTDLDTPNFASGATELSVPMLVCTYVTRWLRDPDNDAVIGARVAVGAMIPDVGHLVSFKGTMHFQFTGFATLGEDETEIQE